jgi:hypothetical protein
MRGDRGVGEPKSPFHELIIDIQQLRNHRDPSPLFEQVDGDLLNGEYHFTSSEDTLTFMSRRIENACFADPGRCSLYSVFRRLSLLEPHLDHYRTLARVARHVIIIGVPDLRIEPWANNVQVITSRAEQLANNWMTINISRDIHMTLLAEELPPEATSAATSASTPTAAPSPAASFASSWRWASSASPSSSRRSSASRARRPAPDRGASRPTRPTRPTGPTMAYRAPSRLAGSSTANGAPSAPTTAIPSSTRSMPTTSASDPTARSSALAIPHASPMIAPLIMLAL